MKTDLRAKQKSEYQPAVDLERFLAVGYDHLLCNVLYINFVISHLQMIDLCTTCEKTSVPVFITIHLLNDCNHIVLSRLLKSDPAQLFEKLEIQARYVQLYMCLHEQILFGRGEVVFFGTSHLNKNSIQLHACFSINRDLQHRGYGKRLRAV